MELSISDLSKYLGVIPDTIERWVRQGKLPVSGKAPDYRFRKVDLEKWAALHHIRLNFSDRQRLEKQNQADFFLSEAVRMGGIHFDIPGGEVKTVLESSIGRISNIPDDFRDDLLERVMERENALSTGIGNGIAIPHPREPLTYLNQALVSICFLSTPVEYNALDRRPVSVLFFILCPSLKLHLNLLSTLSFCLKNTQFIGFLKSKPEPDLLIRQIETLQKTCPA
ncbi:MAG: excisionase [Desulfobacula sp. RIFOXYA12_FULL_46_16]|nr:MAG: excisionase [Desulfobacula sp. RIFOXYA12_FULL_46_16]OGR58582.1 MAG: excisionase [Desulfobacula sp. RIFOXYB2_FULL_45_6]